MAFFNVKQFLLFFMPLSLTVSLLLHLLYTVSINAEKKVILGEGEHHRQLQHKLVIANLHTILADLHILRDQNELTQFVQQGDGKGGLVRAIADEYLSFSQEKGHYDQVRYLDHTGQEVIRINYNNGYPNTVPKEDLQNKGKRYYFHEAFKLNPGEVFISPFDLNIEKGEIESPIKPMLRFGTPLFDKDGRRKGILLLNYLGQGLIDTVENVSQRKGFDQVMVLNAKGYWLIGPNADDNWGFMYADKQDRVFQNKYPEAARYMAKIATGQIDTPAGHFSFSTITPLGSNQAGRGNQPPVASSLVTERSDYQWKLVNFVPVGALEDLARQPYRYYYVLHLANLLFMAIVSCLLSSAIMKRQEVEEKLRVAKDEAENANRAKSVFLSSMSHEIRTPMNGIIGLSHLLQKTELSTYQRDYLQKIQASSHILLGLINNILDVSKIEAGKFQLEVITFQLPQVFDNLANQLGFRAEEQGLELVFSIDPQVPPSLLGDPLRLSQILVNLIVNAIKFTETGEVVVSVKQGKKYNSSIELLFSVKDTGIGLSPEQIDILFQPFNQADQSTTRKYGGTGLGLTISKSLVAMMNGKIWVESALNKGSCFFFTAGFKLGAEGLPSALNPACLTDHRVLVVDDNECACQATASIASSFGCAVTSITSGLKAMLEIERADSAGGERSYDVVLLDWMMPELNGLETARMIKKTLNISQKPAIIMITGYGHQELSDDAHEFLDGFLLKPVTPSLLLETIQQALGLGERGECSIMAPRSKDPSVLSRLIGAKILLVEDNLINQDVARDLLEGYKLVVIIANNGREALKLVQESEFDLILMDIQMPDMDGYEVTRRIRTLDNRQDVPIIALTAFALVSEVNLCLQAGMNEHLAKPIDPDKLEDVLLKWLKPIGRVSPSAQVVTVAKDDLEFPSQIAGIDLSLGLKNVQNKKTFYVELLNKYIDPLKEYSSALLAAIERRDQKEAILFSHSIKSTALTLGAELLSSKAKDIELVLKHDDQPSVMLIAEFVSACDIVVAGLAAFQAEQCEHEAIDVQVSELVGGEDLAKLFQKLDVLLLEGAAEAKDVLSELLRQLEADPVPEKRVQLKRAIDVYEFDKAHTLLLELARLHHCTWVD